MYRDASVFLCLLASSCMGVGVVFAQDINKEQPKNNLVKNGDFDSENPLEIKAVSNRNRVFYVGKHWRTRGQIFFEKSTLKDYTPTLLILLEYGKRHPELLS